MGRGLNRGGRRVNERLSLLWKCRHCGHRSVSTTSIQGTAQEGSKRKPLRFDCKFSGCKRRVRIASRDSSAILAAVNPKKKWMLERLSQQLDINKSEIDAAKIWDPEWIEGDPLPFAFRRWKKWIGDF